MTMSNRAWRRVFDPPLLTAILLILALLALFYRLLAGEVLFWGLPSLQFYPWRAFAFDELRAGRLPAWNPYVGAGAPLLANYQTAVFYPPNWLHLLLPDGIAMSGIAVAHVVWAGIGMWLFTGALGVKDFGRGISTLSYALGGYLIARAGSFPTADAGAWMPWVFWLVHRAIVTRRPRDIGGLALVFGMQLLAGHAQTTWYSCVGAGLYALWWARRCGWPLKALIVVGAGMLLGAAAAAVQVVPTAEYLVESQRSGGLDYKTAANLSYNPFRLATLFSPNFYGTPADGSYITRGIYFEDAAYIGFIPLIAAFAAAAAWVRRRRVLDEHPALVSVPFWTLLALAALAVATGRYGPVFRPLYEDVPTFDAFREPVRWLILTVFSLAVLAGIGVSYWERGKWVVFWSRLAAAGGGAMALMALAFGEIGQPENENLAVLARGLVVLGSWIVCAALLTLVRPDPATGTPPALWRAAVLIGVALDLTWAAGGLNPTVPAAYYDAAEIARPAGRVYWFEDYRHDVTFGTRLEDGADPPAWGERRGYFDLSDYRVARECWREVRAALLPNMTMLDGVYTLNNNDPLLPGVYSRYIDLIEKTGPDATALLQAAGVSRVYGGTPPGWIPATQNETITYAEAPTPASRSAWVAPQAVWFESDTAIEAMLYSDRAWNPAESVYLWGEPPAPDDAPAARDVRQVEVVENDPAARRYRVTTDGAGYLVISETWYPGWSAQVNGRPAELYRANLAFMAVRVPSGESEVTLRYTINHWGTGAALSTLAVGMIGLLFLADWRRRRKKPRPGGENDL